MSLLRANDQAGAVLISSARVRTLVPMVDAIRAVRDAYVGVAEGTFEQPARVSTDDGRFIAMLARSRTLARASSKSLSVTPSNRARSQPTIHAVVALFDERNGQILALIEGASMTALRTGAGVGAATSLLAAPDASTLAVVGAGAQAPDQIRAVLAVRPIKEVRIVSRSFEAASRLVQATRGIFDTVHLRAVATIDEAARDADVICCATSATAPFLHPEHLGPRVHINAIGAYLPHMCELHPDLLSQAMLVSVDQLEAAKAEAGDIIQAVDQGNFSWDRVVEIGRLFGAGWDPVGGVGWSVFKSVGIAAQDLVLADLLYQRAVEDPKTPRFQLSDGTLQAASNRPHDASPS